MALAIYRKYRPRSFAEIIGQEELVGVLKNAGRLGKIAHAYLFYGPRGTGKTTIARLIAKVANCLDQAAVGKNGEPCNQCQICREIDQGRALDVVEIDAASNRGIDDIRNLKENIYLSPAVARSKIFIIDEAHMLTKEAFNALLKVLEEPPDHVIFVLATTEYEKVPATIVSRSQRFHFRRLSVKEILGKLEVIANHERLKVTAGGLELIAAAAEGSLRDAESLLDQVINLADGVDLKAVESTIGRVGFKRVLVLVDQLRASDLQSVLEYLHKLNDDGANLTDLNKELITYLRRVLVFKLNRRMESFFEKELTGEELTKLKEHAAALSAEKLINLIKSLIKAYGEMRYSPFPHVPLEVAIIENLKDN